MVFTHSFIIFSFSFELNLLPSSQVPVSLRLFSFFTLSPKGLDADVQNGITVLPVKLFSLTKLFTGHAAMPYQIG